MRKTILYLAFACLIAFGGIATAARYGSIEAEDFAGGKQGSIKVLSVPFETNVQPDQPHPETGKTGGKYTIKEAYGDKFIGVPNGSGNNSGSYVKYEIKIPASGEWYFWSRVIAPSVADNSFYWAFDIEEKDAVSADTAKTNIWDFYEKESLRKNYTTKWVWFRLNSRTGPFPGRELDQYGKNPTPIKLDKGVHILYLIHREDGTFMDALYWTQDKSYDPNKTPPTAVEPEGKLAMRWGELKRK
jgi:hypothetical protein